MEYTIRKDKEGLHVYIQLDGDEHWLYSISKKNLVLDWNDYFTIDMTAVCHIYNVMMMFNHYYNSDDTPIDPDPFGIEHDEEIEIIEDEEFIKLFTDYLNQKKNEGTN